MNKKVLFGSIAGAVVLAGGVSAFTLIKSPKEAYLNAEYKTAMSAIEQIEDRFEQDIKWGNIVKEDPTKTDIQLSANVDADASSLGFGYLEGVLDAIDSASIDLSVQSDPKENTYALSAGAKILDFKIDPFTAYITDEKVIGEVPFQDEALEMSLERLSELTGEDLDNACLSDEEYKRLMQQQEILSEDDIKHLQKEILPEIYKAIPDEAFEKDGKKITMKLSGKDLEDVLEVAGEVIEDDKVIKRVVGDLINISGECEYYTADEALEELVDAFKNPDIDRSSSIQSVITVDGSQILERELYVNDELVLEGEQDFKDGIVFDYKLKDIDLDTDGRIKGEIGTGKDIHDEISLYFGDEKVLAYESDETNDKKEREFSRELTVLDTYDTYSIKWEGTSSFTGDGKVSDSEISAEVPELGKVTLNLKTDSQKIKGIELPTKTVDLSSKSESELEEYFGGEFAENFEKWAEDLVSELEDLFYGFY